MKLFNFIIIIVLISSFCLAYESTVNTFTGQTNPFNITFIENQERDFILPVPQYSYIKQINISLTNITLNSYYNYSIDYFNVDGTNDSIWLNPYLLGYSDPYNDQRNVSNGMAFINLNGEGRSACFCSRKDRIDFNNNEELEFKLEVDNILGEGSLKFYLCDEKYNFSHYANNLSSCLSFDSGYGSFFGIDLNYKKDNYTINVFKNDTGHQIKLTNSSNAYYYSTNSSGNSSNIGTKSFCICGGVGGAYSHFLEIRFDNVSKRKRNYLNISLNNLQEYSTNFLNELNIFSINTTLANQLLSTNQPLNFTFHSDTAGILGVEILNATYAYGIDNCTNSFNIPSNATSRIFYWKNLGGTLTNVNISSTVSYDSTTTFNYLEEENTLAYCVYPNWYNQTADIDMQYQYGSLLMTYALSQGVFSNNTIDVNFTIDTGSTEVTATVYNEINNQVEGAYIYVQRKDSTTGNYVLTGIFKTNFEGQTKIPLVLDTVTYKFLIYYPLSTLKKITTPTYIYSTSINFQITMGEEILQDYYTEQGVYSNLTYLNDSYRFRYVYSDTSGAVTQGCLYVYKGSNDTLYGSSCLESASGTLYVTIVNQTGVTYIGKSYVTIDGDNKPMNVLSVYFPDENLLANMSYMALIVDFILTIAFAFTITFSMSLAVILIPLPTLFLSLAGLLAVDPAVAIGVEIAALVVAIFLNNR